jgi:hypothetical protein
MCISNGPQNKHPYTENVMRSLDVLSLQLAGGSLNSFANILIVYVK